MRPPAAEAALFAWFGWRRNREARRPDLASSSCSKRGVKIWQKGWRRGGGDEERIKVLYYTLVLAYEKASTTCKNSFFHGNVWFSRAVDCLLHADTGKKGNCFVMHKALCLHYIERTCASCPPKETTGFYSFLFRYSHNPTTHTDISRLLLPLLPMLKYSCAATGK